MQQQLKVNEGQIIEIPSSLKQLNGYHSTPVSLENIKSLSTSFNFKPEDGEVVGRHQGAHFYTIGQRKGLQIGGRPKPSFVIQTDTVNNIVYSGQEDHHLGLNRWALKVDYKSVIYSNLKNRIAINTPVYYDVRIRYRQPLQKAQLILLDDGLYVLFDKLQRGITPGQFCAWYKDDELLGSGVIQH